MRVFIALETPKEVHDELIKLQKGFFPLIKGSFTKEFHLTLKFLGEVQEGKIKEIKGQLSEIKFNPFNLSLDVLGVFPNQDYIRVLWVGLKPKDKVLELQQKIEMSLNEIGFSKDKSFSSHITLARVKFVDNKQKLKEELTEKPNEISFDVNEFKLIKSTLTSQGPIYETIETYKLK